MLVDASIFYTYLVETSSAMNLANLLCAFFKKSMKQPNGTCLRKHILVARQFKGFVLSTGPSSQDYVMQKNLPHFGSMAHELGMVRGAID